MSNAQCKIYKKHEKNKERALLKTNEIEFNYPPQETTYHSENMSKLEYMDISRKTTNMSSKVASYVLDQIEDQLNFAKPMDFASNIVSGEAEVKNKE